MARSDNLPSPDDLVISRGAWWRVLGVQRGEECHAVRLLRRHPPPHGSERTLIEPFDRIEPLRPVRRVQVVTGRRARSRLLAAVIRDRPWHEPASAATAPVDLLDWQLVPCALLLAGLTRRVLLADGVGLGKTIQAGLVMREWLARWPESRVLVLVPAGLREQWRDELRRALAIDAVVVDREWVEREASLTPGLNPWSTVPVAITSVDFAKRGEVLPGPDQVAWDLVVVDEAHELGAGTARLDMVDAVCRDAARVMLLTATPHDGNEAKFRALCRVGAIAGEPDLPVVRRERSQVHTGLATRKWRTWILRPDAAHAHVHSLLDHYLERLAGESGQDGATAVALLGPLLRKRAASSAWSLRQTVLRRRTLLEARAGENTHSQPSLPWTDEALSDGDGPDEILQMRGLNNWRMERAWLGSIAHAAERASRFDPKVSWVRRWLRRSSEPLLVFTEYRDTLTCFERAFRRALAVALLHGGMTAAERARSVDTFGRGRARVLLATDAASEGLNLQHGCRATVLVDLPWTPNTLEQRIGRLDRLGQTRRVHAIGLCLDTAFDRALLARLQDCRERTQMALESGPAGPAIETAHSLARSACGRLSARRAWLTLVGASRLRRGPTPRKPAVPRLYGGQGPSELIPVVCLRPSRIQRDWSGAIVVVELEVGEPSMVVERCVVALHVAMAVPRLRGRQRIGLFVGTHIDPIEAALLERAWSSAEGRASRGAAQWLACRSLAARVARESSGHASHRRLRQQSLFGRYAPAAPADRRASDAVHSRPPLALDENALSRQSRVVLILLRPGGGHPPFDREGA